MRTLEQIKKEQEILDDELSQCFNDDSLDGFIERSNIVYSKMRPLKYEKDIQSNIVWKDKPEYGDLMTLEDFIECCECGGFIDYDGSGYYSDGQKESNISTWPSMIRDGFIINNPNFTHIIWYNK